MTQTKRPPTNPGRFTAGNLRARSGHRPGRNIVPVHDNTGWHDETGLQVPEGARPVFLPPCTPELQPAETLGALIYGPIVNRHARTINDLDEVVAKRFIALVNERETIKNRAGFN